MNFVAIRKSFGFAQVEIAILFGVPVGSIRDWEQSQRNPDSAAITLYRLVSGKDQDVLVAMVTVACQKQYTELEDVQVLKKLITKVINNKILHSLLEVMVLESNPHWKPEELGFRVTRI